MKLLPDTFINQPKSALNLLAENAGSSLDMNALIKAIHTQDSVILEKDNALLKKDDIIQKKSVVIDEQKKRITLLEEFLRLERARLYGRSTEKVRVKEILQEKAVFIEQDEYQQDKRVIKAAELPKHPIPKSAVTVCMLAYIIVAKYCDALPLYRLEKILTRYGGSITRTTMANWLIRLSLQLQPLINLMMDHQRAGHIINADETTVQVIKETKKSINSDKLLL